MLKITIIIVVVLLVGTMANHLGLRRPPKSGSKGGGVGSGGNRGSSGGGRSGSGRPRPGPNTGDSTDGSTGGSTDGTTGSTLQGLTEADTSLFVNENVGGTDCARVSLTYYDGTFSFSSNGVPDHGWNDLVNPNNVTSKNYNLEFDEEISVASTPGCLSGGPIGYATNGVPFYNSLTSSGVNAVEGNDAELMDFCDGHSDPMGGYHYHQFPWEMCSPNFDMVADQLIGVALDGFPIYGPYKDNGAGDLTEVTNDELDECHGEEVNGQYRYRATRAYPYLVGCFKGEVKNNKISYICANGVNEMCTCEYGSLTAAETGVTQRGLDKLQRKMRGITIRNVDASCNAGRNKKRQLVDLLEELVNKLE